MGKKGEKGDKTKTAGEKEGSVHERRRNSKVDARGQGRNWIDL